MEHATNERRLGSSGIREGFTGAHGRGDGTGARRRVRFISQHRRREGKDVGSLRAERRSYRVHDQKIDSKYFPLEPGTTFVYRGETEHATEGDIVEGNFDMKNVMGVECVVVDDRVTEGGKLIEQTYDWYA